MNLSTLSRLPAESFPELGKSRRQIAEEAAAEERKNAKPSGPPPMTSAPAGYEVTAQGGLRRKDQPWIVPETKGRTVKAEQINVQPLTDAVAKAMQDNGELPDAQPADSGEVPSVEDVRLSFFAAASRIATHDPCPVVDEVLGYEWCGTFCNIPADRRAEVIRALNQLGA